VALSSFVGALGSNTYEIVPEQVKSLSKEAVLRFIAVCESGDRQFDENGYPLTGKANPNDIGRYQINRIHLGEALSMGLDIYQDRDNRVFAEHLLKEQGLKPWLSSSACWKPLIGSSNISIGK
jgi:hypothetical protein